MVNVIGVWPDHWRMMPVGDDPMINEDYSDGNAGVRVIPPHLADVDEVGTGEAGAILITHHRVRTDSGEERDYWDVAIQSKHSIYHDTRYGYLTHWERRGLSKRRAKALIDSIVEQLQYATQLSELPQAYS